MTRTALVTGGSAGIGAALAAALAARGHAVLSLDRAPPEAPTGGVTHVPCDLLDPEATARAAADIAARHTVTLLIHNAGMILPNLVEDARPEDIARLSQLHLGAALTLLQATLPAMKAQRFGRVVLTSSRAALGTVTRTAYSATKAGMIGMARTWALELAPHGITVNVVAPGPIRTANFWDIVPKGSDREADLARRIPVGRLGEPADVVRAMLFLLDDEAGFVTGQTLNVCGGASIGSTPI